jgi:WD40 repeat protein
MIEKSKELNGHGAGIYSLAFDGEFLYSGSADQFVTRWDLSAGTQDKFAIRFDFPVYAITVFNHQNFLAVGLSNGNLHVFDLRSKQEVKFFTQHVKAIFSIVENANDNQLYVADADGNLSVWNTSTFDLLLYLPLDCGKIRRITVSTTGGYFAVVGQDGNARVFETTFFNELSCFFSHTGGATAVLFHPYKPEVLITGGKDAFLRYWDWKTGTLLEELPSHNFVLYDILAINDGKQILTASRDKTIKIWDSQTTKFLQRLDTKWHGHRHSVNCLIPLNTTTFASASDDKRIIIWKFSVDSDTTN